MEKKIAAKALFIVTGSDKGTWLSEVTHPYWHLLERGIEIDIATPNGNKIVWDPQSDPATKGSDEPDDLVSMGFTGNSRFFEKLAHPLKLSDVEPNDYGVVHFAGGLGATYDLYL